MKLHTLDTGFFKLDGGAMFGVVPKTIWRDVNPPDENNMCTWAMRCLLVELGNRLIVIDTGIGRKQSEKFFQHYYLHGDDTLEGSIKARGYTPEDVTDVFLTHLHFDHCGGAINHNEAGESVMTFPKAQYWSNKPHWDWATRPNARERASFLKENFAPLQEQGKIRFVDDVADGRPFGEGFDIVYVDGHTERQMLPLLTQESGKRFLFMADLIPSVGHLPLPYVMGYDMRPLISLREKDFTLNRCFYEQIDLIFEHDPLQEACTLIKTEKGVRAGETYQLASKY